MYYFVILSMNFILKDRYAFSMMDKLKYLTPKDAAEILGVTQRTLLNYGYDGKLTAIRTQGGHRRYKYEDVVRIKSIESNGRSICYARVSTYDQKEDLSRQIKFLTLQYPNHEVIQDIGSGLNFKRKGFSALLDSALQGNIKEIVVTDKDRLCRFGFELLQEIIVKASNGRIVVLNKRSSKPEDRLVDDILSIITVFSSRLHGLRSGRNKRAIKKQLECESIGEPNRLTAGGTSDGEYSDEEEREESECENQDIMYPCIS